MLHEDLKVLYIAYERAKSLRALLGSHSTASLTHDQKIAFDIDYERAFDKEYVAYCAYRAALQKAAKVPPTNPATWEDLGEPL